MQSYFCFFVQIMATRILFLPRYTPVQKIYLCFASKETAAVVPDTQQLHLPVQLFLQ